MPVKKKDISPVLFFTDEGVPMLFYVRPGPAKQQLEPLVTAGGGLLSNVQQPDAILLLDPQETSSIPETSADWYVSTQYIYDCVDEEAQLDLEDYRLQPRESPSSNSSSVSLQGRMKYTPEEDAAILRYLRQHQGAKMGGNQIWQQMKKECVTEHSWMSMKYRYTHHISKQQNLGGETSAEAGPSTTAEGGEGAKDAGNLESMCSLTLSSDDDEDLQQSKMSVDDVEEDAKIPSTLLTPRSSSEETGDLDLSPDEVFPAGQATGTDQALDQSGPSPCSSTPTKCVVQPVRKSLRRRLTMDTTPPAVPFKMFQSSASDFEGPPQTPLKSTAADASPGNPPEESPAAEAQEEEPGPTGETPADEPESGEQLGESRQPGILELAAMEFKDDSETESMEDDPPEGATAESDPEPGMSTSCSCPGPSEPAAADEPVLATSEAHLFIFDSETQTEPSQPDQGVGQDQDQGTDQGLDQGMDEGPDQGQGLGLDQGPDEGQGLGLDQGPDEGQDQGPDQGQGPDQVQLEGDVHRLKELMKESGQDLVSVTEALLKTSGDFYAALDLLTGEGSVAQPFWSRMDDEILQSGDLNARAHLQEKYGEEGVAKRMLFLEVEL